MKGVVAPGSGALRATLATSEPVRPVTGHRLGLTRGAADKDRIVVSSLESVDGGANCVRGCLGYELERTRFLDSMSPRVGVNF